jgi:dienelactone hydrolase
MQWPSPLRTLQLRGIAVQNKILGARTAPLVAKALLLGALLAASSLAIAAPSEEGGSYPPDRTGPYSIGHTTVVVTDTSRNLDGSTPVTSSGRPLYLHIWYPTTVKTSQHVRYTWNNPLYNQNPAGTVYPGLPDVPALTFIGSSSFNPVAERAPLATATFPLLVASHGNEVAAAKNTPDTLETLASHGYIVASVEHTGNDDAWFQASFLESPVGLSLGPNPRIGPGLSDGIFQRSKDVSFVIDAVLQGVVDQKAGIAFSAHIDSEKIGVLGYSLGGETSLATVTGIGTAGLPADSRVKAAFMGAGTNYGLILNSADYANAKVPLLFYGNDTGIAYDNFNAFTHSDPRYLVDVGGINHHTGGYQTSWCQDFRNSMIAVNPNVFPLAFINPALLSPTDIANYVYDATFYFIYSGPRESGIYDYCEPSVFNGISNAQLVAVLFGDSRVLAVRNELQGSMPLKPEVSISETTRLANWYAVSFFNQTLKHDHDYDRYLTNSAANRRTNPLVNFVADCEKATAHPIDLQPGDRISFMPVGNTGFNVSVTSGATLLDPGTTKLKVGGDGSVYLSYPGFSFPVPGLPAPISTLIVDENGILTARTSPDFTGIDDNGSPWYTKGQLLLSNRFTIAALMKDLDSTAAATGGGVFGYFDAANGRVIVTYNGVPATGTTQPNTLQVVIHDSGKLEMIVGALAATGAIYSPGILGTVGIASGQTKASDLRKVKPISFSELRNSAPVFVPFGRDGAIYEQFYLSKGASCSNDDDAGD